jgi:hypothetical protein
MTTESQKPDESENGLSDLPPGTYQVDEDGNVREAVNWQPMLERIPWERVNEFLDSWGKRGAKERLVNLWGMYILSGIVIIIVGGLAWIDVIDGQATVGFLGAAMGYLLSRANTKG